MDDTIPAACTTRTASQVPSCMHNSYSQAGARQLPTREGGGVSVQPPDGSSALVRLRHSRQQLHLGYIHPILYQRHK